MTETVIGIYTMVVSILLISHMLISCEYDEKVRRLNDEESKRMG